MTAIDFSQLTQRTPEIRRQTSTDPRRISMPTSNIRQRRLVRPESFNQLKRRSIPKLRKPSNTERKT